MTFIIKKLKPALYIALLLFSNNVNAQVSLIDNLIDKLEGYHNFSYQSINKRRDMSADTTIAYNKELFLKAPNDKLFGYLYSIETDHKTEAFHRIDLYNGESIKILSPIDTSFFSEKQPSAYNQSLIGSLKFLKGLYNKRPFAITNLKDTTINGITNSHFIANVSDTIDNNEHLYSRRDFYIDKQTGLPSLVIIKGRYKYLEAVNDYYDETKYFDYYLNQADVTVTRFAVPNDFHPRKKQTVQPALALGTAAPDWTLYDANGKKISLSQMKGKVVVLDFYFIGCTGCMLSLKPLNNIYEKYKNKEFILASINARDSKKAVLDFEKRYKIKYPGYIKAAGVVKSYNVTAFPTYYIIDKEGKIANVTVGYNDDFKQKVTTQIEQMLNN